MLSLTLPAGFPLKAPFLRADVPFDHQADWRPGITTLAGVVEAFETRLTDHLDLWEVMDEIDAQVGSSFLPWRWGGSIYEIIKKGWKRSFSAPQGPFSFAALPHDMPFRRPGCWNQTRRLGQLPRGGLRLASMPRWRWNSRKQTRARCPGCAFWAPTP